MNDDDSRLHWDHENKGPLGDEEWTTDSSDDDTSSSDDPSTPSTPTSDSGSQLSEGRVIASKHCSVVDPSMMSQFSRMTTPAVERASVPVAGGLVVSESNLGGGGRATTKSGSGSPRLTTNTATAAAAAHKNNKNNEKRKKLEKELYRNCTFQPTIVTRRPKGASGKSPSPTNTNTNTNTNALNFDDSASCAGLSPSPTQSKKEVWVDRLYTKEHTRRQTKQKTMNEEVVPSYRKKEIEEFVEHCTFKPQILKSHTGGGASSSSYSAFERLYGDPKHAAKKKEKDPAEPTLLEKKELEQCTFKPEVTDMAKNMHRAKSVFEGLSYARQPSTMSNGHSNSKQNQKLGKNTTTKHEASPKVPSPGRSNSDWWNRMHHEYVEKERRLQEKQEQSAREEFNTLSTVHQGKPSNEAVFNRLYGVHPQHNNDGPRYYAPPPTTQITPIKAPKPNKRVGFISPNLSSRDSPASQRQPKTLQSQRETDAEKLRVLNTVIAVHVPPKNN
eukprot:PhF_6_TR7040/c0_g1_i3/m.10572